uniref:uronyl 2-sulfotransferase-like n=1 Tax=Styela clava TaxID=7725 RepID=UPI00193A48D9|nr:uronyl 2-sulfotransferase-like [Styela clava]
MPRFTKQKLVLTVASVALLVYCFRNWEPLKRVDSNIRNDKYKTVSRIKKNTENKSIELDMEAFKQSRTRTVFYNRVGKCGSRALMALVNHLSGRNNFWVQESLVTAVEHPGVYESLQEMMTINNLVPPSFYNRHIHYLDFKRYHLKKPIYINMIRDPIERFASHYNYLKYGDLQGEVKTGSQSDLEDINDCVDKSVGVCDPNSEMMFYIGLYFCGVHDPPCLQPDEHKRVEIATTHIDEDYLFVGILEEFETTLLLLEKLLPGYFTGVMKVRAFQNFQQRKNETATRKQDFLTDKSREKLRTINMVDEYKVYFHVKEKFNKLKQKFGIS